MAWSGIMLDGCAEMHVFQGGTLSSQRYRNKIFEPSVCLFRGTIGLQFIFMDDNVRLHALVEE